jgi:hypothetical protein
MMDSEPEDLWTAITSSKYDGTICVSIPFFYCKSLGTTNATPRERGGGSGWRGWIKLEMGYELLGDRNR